MADADTRETTDDRTSSTTSVEPIRLEWGARMRLNTRLPCLLSIFLMSPMPGMPSLQRSFENVQATLPRRGFLPAPHCREIRAPDWWIR